MGENKLSRAILNQKLTNILGDDFHVILWDGFDEAIVGIATQFGKNIALYNREKCIEILMENGDMDYDEADEYFSFNIEGGWIGEQTPALFTPID